MRTALREGLQPLLLGSSTEGVHLHDIVLQYIRKRLSEEEMRAEQRKVVVGMLPASLGGSILGSMGTHTQTWMSRTEYDDHGAALIHRKGMDTQEFW